MPRIVHVPATILGVKQQAGNTGGQVNHNQIGALVCYPRSTLGVRENGGEEMDFSLIRPLIYEQISKARQ